MVGLPSSEQGRSRRPPVKSNQTVTPMSKNADASRIGHQGYIGAKTKHDKIDSLKDSKIG